VKVQDTRILRRRQQKLQRRLKRKQWSAQTNPMLTARNIQYEMAERTRVLDCGAVGAFHLLARNTGLIRTIDKELNILKRHLPYHESDHVLNIAYNTLSGGTCLDDIELRRNDETYMDALGTERIPDPTTAGDFTRRFTEEDVGRLMDAINAVRPGLWRKRLNRQEREEAVLDVDGTIAPTTGECKQGMGLSYKGVWGYHPLLVSLANTLEPLYLVNRSGNKTSHDGAAEWIDRAIEQVSGTFARVCLRGDTAFSLTTNFDRWTEQGVRFAFGKPAHPSLVKLAEGLPGADWQPLERRARKNATGSTRQRPARVKEAIVKEKGYRNLRLEREDVAEVPYRTARCQRSYRLVVLRKRISVEEGQRFLWEEVRYLFYITNIEEMSPAEVVLFCNGRCNQENLIEQLKNGLNALRMPVGDLVANWAYMVMASLAWTLKAWFALLVRRTEYRERLLRMDFRQFLNVIVRQPAQIVRAGRRIVFRMLGYNRWTRTFLLTFSTIRQLRLA
jgi:hypothetical protein